MIKKQQLDQKRSFDGYDNLRITSSWLTPLSNSPFFGDSSTEWSSSKLLYYSWYIQHQAASVCSRNTIDLYAFDESHITLFKRYFFQEFFLFNFLVQETRWNLCHYWIYETHKVRKCLQELGGSANILYKKIKVCFFTVWVPRKLCGSLL